MNELIAKRYIGTIDTGISKPFVVECFDNRAYVVKYIGNNQSDKILINDLICCRLAKQLGLLVPDPKVVIIPRALVEMETELQELGVQSGKHFGSLYYKNTVSFTGESSLKSISNKDQIPKIIAFDFWVGNDDRADNLGNLLISTTKNENNIISIDYGNAFNGPDWIKEDLEFIDISIIPVDGMVYSCLFNEIKNEGCFDEICTEEIPKEWGLHEEQRELICNFLFNRKDKVRDTIHYVLKEKLKL